MIQDRDPGDERAETRDEVICRVLDEMFGFCPIRDVSLAAMRAQFPDQGAVETGGEITVTDLSADFHFYTGAPVPLLPPETVGDREADYGRSVARHFRSCPHPVEDAFALPPAAEPVSLDADEDDHEIYVENVSAHFAPGSRVYRVGYAARRGRDTIDGVDFWPFFEEAHHDAMFAKAFGWSDSVVFVGPWGAFPA